LPALCKPIRRTIIRPKKRQTAELRGVTTITMLPHSWPTNSVNASRIYHVALYLYPCCAVTITHQGSQHNLNLLCKTSYKNMPALQIWENPATEKPVLEPCFVAAFHGIELCFLLLAEFISDDRKYVFRRPRVEMVANDIQKQCLLLTEVSKAVACCCRISHVESRDKSVTYALHDPLLMTTCMLILHLLWFMEMYCIPYSIMHWAGYAPKVGHFGIISVFCSH